MKKNRWVLRMVTLLLVSGMLSATVSFAADPGSGDDPLITLSYLNETFFNSVMTKVDEKISVRNNQIAGSLGDQGGAVNTAAQNFTVVTLTKGQILTGDIGCEVMLRVGSANCVAPSSPGLIDETAASTLDSGQALVKNHLYMMTIEGRGVQATAETTKVLVRGTYTVA